MSYQSTNMLLHKEPQEIVASETARQISSIIEINDPNNIVVDVIMEDLVVADEVEITLQTQANEGPWVDCKSVTPANASTIATITVTQVGDVDEAVTPMRPKARVVCTTGTGDSVTVTAVYVSRKLSV